MGKPVLLFLAVIFIAPFGFDRAKAQEASALLEQVRAAHKSARQAIRTMSATMQVEATYPNRRLLGEGKYWRDGDTVRVHSDGVGGGNVDYRVSAGEVRQVITFGANKALNKAGLPGRARRQSEYEFATRTDVFYELLLTQRDVDSRLADLDTLLSEAASDISTRQHRLDGEDCVAVTFSGVNRRYGHTTKLTYWFAREKNYLIKRIEGASGEKHTFVRSVTSWAEPSSGVIVPTSSETISYDDGKLAHSRKAVLSELVVNVSIPPSTMSLPVLPRGSLLIDEIAGVEGYVDSNWQPIGKMERHTRHMVPSLPSSSGPVKFTQQSTSEPESINLWVLGVSVILLVLGLGMTIYRRLRLVEE